jgi:hypothetical protein
MARNGSGTYVRTDGVRTGSTVFAQEQSAGINILATNLDVEAQDMADALTASIAKDGQTVPTANLPMGGYKHTGVADATADTQYATLGQSKSLFNLGLEWVTGLRITNNVTDPLKDIDIAAGSIMDSTNVYRLNASAFTKRIDATFAVGSNLGGRSNNGSSAALAPSTFYAVFQLGKSSNPSDCDFIFATTQALALADTVAVSAGFNLARRVSWVFINSSSNFLTFGAKNNRHYQWTSTQQNVDTGTFPTANRTLIAVAAPPLQTAVVNCQIRQTDATATNMLFTSPSGTDDTPNSNTSDLSCAGDAVNTAYNNITKSIVVDSSSRIGYRASQTPAGGNIDVWTTGWIDDLTIWS